MPEIDPAVVQPLVQRLVLRARGTNDLKLMVLADALSRAVGMGSPLSEQVARVERRTPTVIEAAESLLDDIDHEEGF